VSTADVPALLRALVASDPGRPRLTWYGPDGERVELSARVLDNWVAKTANLLVEELDAEPGTTVRLDLPPHWRTAVWALAVWAVGGELVDGEADVVVGCGAEAAGGSGRRVAVALPALARAVDDLPSGALDYNAEVSGFGDVFAPVGPPTPVPAAAWVGSQPRVLVAADAWDPVRALLAPLLADGSVVLCSDAVPGERLEAVAADEKVTDRL
jgi:uncharacterized protein (TIGR03089 family)